VLIAESNVQHVPDMVDELYVIERGEIFDSGDPQEVSQRKEVQELMQGSGQEE
jgi:branched-chain amino acid transport system ATP-binding protein